MSIKSINEPAGPGRLNMLTPMSINEPLTPDDVPQPVIESIEPTGCVIGDPDFTLVVRGTGFTPVSMIFFAGHDEPTTHNADGSLSTGVKPSLWASPVDVVCQVRNGDKYSAPVTFSFAAARGVAKEASRGVTSDDDDVSREKGDRDGHGSSHGRGGRAGRR